MGLFLLLVNKVCSSSRPTPPLAFLLPHTHHPRSQPLPAPLPSLTNSPPSFSFFEILHPHYISCSLKSSTPTIFLVLRTPHPHPLFLLFQVSPPTNTCFIPFFDFKLFLELMKMKKSTTSCCLRSTYGSVY